MCIRFRTELAKNAGMYFLGMQLPIKALVEQFCDFEMFYR